MRATKKGATRSHQNPPVFARRWCDARAHLSTRTLPPPCGRHPCSTALSIRSRVAHGHERPVTAFEHTLPERRAASSERPVFLQWACPSWGSSGTRGVATHFNHDFFCCCVEHLAVPPPPPPPPPSHPPPTFPWAPLMLFPVPTSLLAICALACAAAVATWLLHARRHKVQNTSSFGGGGCECGTGPGSCGAYGGAAQKIFSHSSQEVDSIEGGGGCECGTAPGSCGACGGVARQGFSHSSQEAITIGGASPDASPGARRARLIEKYQVLLAEALDQAEALNRSTSSRSPSDQAYSDRSRSEPPSVKSASPAHLWTPERHSVLARGLRDSARQASPGVYEGAHTGRQRTPPTPGLTLPTRLPKRRVCSVSSSSGGGGSSRDGRSPLGGSSRDGRSPPSSSRMSAATASPCRLSPGVSPTGQFASPITSHAQKQISPEAKPPWHGSLRSVELM